MACRNDQTENHYTSDLILGVGLGLFAGYVVPEDVALRLVELPAAARAGPGTRHGGPAHFQRRRFRAGHPGVAMMVELRAAPYDAP